MLPGDARPVPFGRHGGRVPLTVVLSGDALITRRYDSDDPAQRAFAELVQSADVAFTNLESC
jgi:hypothetical protein